MAGKESPGKKHDGLDLELLSNRDDPAESRTVASRKRIREMIAQDVQRYLTGGGQVEVVDGSEVEAPDKPHTTYGGRPI